MLIGESFSVAAGSLHSANCVACPLRVSGVCKYIRAEIATGNCNSGREMSCASDRIIMGEGVHPAQLWVVRAGLLRVQRFGMDGRRQILSLILPGEMVGLDQRDHNDLTVETASESKLCRVDMRHFNERMAADSELRRVVYLQQRDQLERIRWLTWSLGVLKPEERFSAFLAVSTRFMPYQPMPDGSGILTMQLRRSDIADLLGTTVESISRISHRLNAAGLVLIVDPKHFRIPDLAKLASHGCIEQTFRGLPFGSSFAGQGRAGQAQTGPIAAPVKMGEQGHDQHLSTVPSVTVPAGFEGIQAK